MTTTSQTAFDRLASAIADFGSPFYEEERQRDVWNEASAFGFQSFLWATLVLSGVMLWTGGTAVAPYATALLVLNGLISTLVLTYARRLGVTVHTRPKPGRLVALALVVLFVLGGLWHADAPTGDWSTVLGAVVGAAVAVTAAFLAPALIARRKRARGNGGADEEAQDLGALDGSR